MKTYDYLIVGSGLFGATFAHLAHLRGKRCLVIDKRRQLGGNVYCEQVEGINVHKYGAHIFHTSNKEVWDFVNSLVPFNRYTNSPVANFHGKLYNLPFNMNTFHQMWGCSTPSEAYDIIHSQCEDEIRRQIETGKRLASGEATDKLNLEEQALSLVGRDIYETLIKEYTEKQWGRECKELPAFIIRRLPLRFTFDNNYFNDSYQGIPIGGYNNLIDRLLEGVETKVGVDFFKSEYRDWQQYASNLVYTGQIDEFFDYRLGRLNWRTVSFKTRVENMPNFQGNAVVNYTSHDVPYTRVIEHKHFEMFGERVYDNPKTVVSEEYSTEYKPGMEPYYPVNDLKNNEIADGYRSLAANLANASAPTSAGQDEGKIIFGGRLAEYKYYDMAPVIANAMKLFQ